MAVGSSIRVRYWGVTGSYQAPLSREALHAKLVDLLEALRRNGSLAKLAGINPPSGRASIEHALAALPFDIRSTYGGNTTCIEVETPDAMLVIDAGGGIRCWSAAQAQRWAAADWTGPRKAHLLLTHPHLDHLLALPFADVLYDPQNEVTVWAPPRAEKGLWNLFDAQAPLAGLYFPPTLDDMPALRDWRTLTPGDSFDIGGTHIETLALNHPGGSLGYRITHNGVAYVVATDHECTGADDQPFIDFLAGAAAAYVDAQYVAAELTGLIGIAGEPPRSRVGWGHSSVESVVAAALAAGVRELHLGHHEPKRSDAELAQHESYAQQIAAEQLAAAGRPLGSLCVSAAYEGLEIRM